MNRLRHVIIGNGAAAINAAKAIREIDTKSDVIMLSAEKCFAYSPVVLPYLLSRRIREEKMYLTDRRFYEERSIDFRWNCRVVGIDARRQRLYTETHSHVDYDRLLIATGASPRRLRVAEDVQENVYTLRTLHDAKNIINASRHAADALMIGAGLVGLETAYALKKAGKSVTIMAKSKQLLSRNSDRLCAEMIQKEIEKEGITFLLGRDVVGIEKEKEKLSVKTDRGEKLNTDLIVVGKGVQPNMQLVEGTGIRIESGIRVDFRMKTDVENIYAAGDVAEARNLLTGGYETFGNWPSACREGATAGRNMAGKDTRLAGEISHNVLPVFDCIGAFAEKREPEDQKTEVFTYVHERKNIYRKVLIRNDRIVGAVLLGEILDAGVILDFIRKRRKVASIKNGLPQDSISWGHLMKQHRSPL